MASTTFLLITQLIQKSWPGDSPTWKPQNWISSVKIVIKLRKVTRVSLLGYIRPIQLLVECQAQLLLIYLHQQGKEIHELGPGQPLNTLI